MDKKFRPTESILKEASAKDATRMRARARTRNSTNSSKTSRLSGASPRFDHYNKSLNMDDFLTAHPIGSGHQGDDRQTALQLKDILNAYNNNGHH